MGEARLIKDFMTKIPTSVGLGETITDAMRVMSREGVRHLPVVEAHRVLGLLSQRELELVGALEAIDPARTSVEIAMIPEPYHVAPDTPLAEVVAEMADKKMGSSLVMENDELLGVFTTTDALAALAKFLGE